MQAQRPIEIRNPYSVRPYQHVLEPLSAYLLIAQRQHEDKKFVGSYNVGPESTGCLATGELANLFCKAWGEGARWVHTGQEGPHEDNILKLDCAKIQAVLGWQPRWDIERAIRETVGWTKTWLSGLYGASNPQIFSGQKRGKEIMKRRFWWLNNSPAHV